MRRAAYVHLTDYLRETCLHAESMRSRVCYCILNEWLTNREIDDTVAAVRKLAAHLRERVR